MFSVRHVSRAKKDSLSDAFEDVLITQGRVVSFYCPRLKIQSSADDFNPAGEIPSATCLVLWLTYEGLRA